jgi:primosomal protein N' (replication factor Y)
VELGAGTEKIAEMLMDIIPKSYNVQISRMDIDTTSRKGSQRRMLHDFSTGKTDILLGTQMVAKGIDIERVTLVGVINADLSMFHPDFRATERTYQLLTQVAGRSGRHASKPGKVVVQTYAPHHPAITALVSHSGDSFFQNELEMRRLSNYPPFCRFIRIEFSHKHDADVKNYAQLFVQILKKLENEFFEILGPTIPTIPKLKGMYRSLIIIKNNKTLDPSGWYFRSALQQSLTTFKNIKGSSTVRIVVDIDSYQGV